MHKIVPNFERKSSVGEANFQNMKDYEYSLDSIEKYAKEGYGQNSTIFSAINKIAKCAASVIPRVRVNGEPVEDHPLLTILKRPNPDEGGVEFRRAAFSWYLLTGNSFTERLGEELWNWKPYQMEIGKSVFNPRMPGAYRVQNTNHHWPVDVNGRSEMLHFKTFNPDPECLFYGQSPLQAGASAGDQLNAANKWRYNTFKNDCRPSGVMSTDQPIESKKRKELQKDLSEEQSGSNNAGKTMLLGGGLKWTQMSMTPKDADWLNGSKYNKQEICEAFEIPPQLLGIEGSQTFANYSEAREAFYYDTVLPLVDLYFDELNRWLAPTFGDNVEIYYETSEINALSASRAANTKILLDSTVLTTNEKREVLGYERDENLEANQIFIDANKIPLGLDVFGPGEEDIEQVAKALMRSGLPRMAAETKAMELLACEHK